MPESRVAIHHRGLLRAPGIAGHNQLTRRLFSSVTAAAAAVSGQLHCGLTHPNSPEITARMSSFASPASTKRTMYRLRRIRRMDGGAGPGIRQRLPGGLPPVPPGHPAGIPRQGTAVVVRIWMARLPHARSPRPRGGSQRPLVQSARPGSWPARMAKRAQMCRLRPLPGQTPGLRCPGSSADSWAGSCQLLLGHPWQAVAGTSVQRGPGHWTGPHRASGSVSAVPLCAE